MKDGLYSFMEPDLKVVVALAVTTKVCQTAQQRHRLAPTSAIAMGRLLTAAALAGLVHRRGDLSLQMVGEGHLGQMYADVTPQGHLRGYVKNPTLAISGAERRQHHRRNIGTALGRGVFSVIRIPAAGDTDNGQYSQSSVELCTGEVDDDLERFFAVSDQVQSAVTCDVLLDDDAGVVCAAGVLVKALPDTAHGALDQVRPKLRAGLADWLAEHVVLSDSRPEEPAQALVQHFLPQAAESGPSIPLVWRCRCSLERVNNSLKLLPAADLAKMVDENKPAQVRCDFCNAEYSVPTDEVERIFLETITAKG